MSSLRTLLLPGIFVHELAHFLFVILTPKASVDEVDFTSHVKHSGRYTFPSIFLISYAPLIVNSFLAILFSYVFGVYVSLTPKGVLIGGLSIYLCLVLSITAFPSFEDAITTWEFFTDMLFSIKFPIAIIISPFIILFIIPGVIATYILSNLSFLKIPLGLVYGFLMLYIGLVLAGILEPPLDLYSFKVYGALW